MREFDTTPFLRWLSGPQARLVELKRLHYRRPLSAGCHLNQNKSNCRVFGFRFAITLSKLRSLTARRPHPLGWWDYEDLALDGSLVKQSTHTRFAPI